MAIAAIDLGATSGRVMLGIVADGRLELEEVRRFPHSLQDRGGHLCWDIEHLWAEVRAGLADAGARARDLGLDSLASIGIDAWAVDFQFVGPDGDLIDEAISYRDGRTEGVAARLARSVSAERQFRITGIAQQPFTTIFQLACDDRLDALPDGTTALLLPDLFAFLLTGERRTELTNASTTGLLDAAAHRFDPELLEAAGVRGDLLAPLIRPGERIGTVLPERAAELGIGEVPVVAVGSHDTASAVFAVPASAGTDPVAYISSGTWSLVGLDLPAPVLTERARQAGFTNEAGVDGSIRFLKNVMGMWLLSESIRQWQGEVGASDPDSMLVDLLDAAAAEPAGRFLIDATDPAFGPPGEMADRITARARDTSGRGEQPGTRAQLVRCVLDSLARAYRDTLAEACTLAQVPAPRIVHVVGGGSRNTLLNRLTADALGTTLRVGPVEATALGNLTLQAQALGLIDPGADAARAVVRASTMPGEVTPSPVG